jgi:mxaA protein
MADRCRLALCAWLVLMPAQTLAQSAIDTLDVTAPRAFGWRIGDVFERLIVLRLHSPYRLVGDSLPSAGRHTPWLALARPDIDEDAAGATTTYRIRMRYQLVNISPDFPDIALPEVMLRMSNGKETQQALIPASRLRVGTITDFTGHDRRPPQAPAPLPPAPWRQGWWGALLFVALAGLAWLQWGSAFGVGARPFAQLKRRLGGAGDTAWSGDAYDETLRAIHHAFNTTAGRAVFGETLDDFLVDAPRFVAASADIREFFRRSSGHFYRGAADVPVYSRAELARFVSACADLERGLG